MISTKRIFVVALAGIVTFTFSFLANGAGEVDPSFNPALIQVQFASSSINKTAVRRVVIQPDGKVILAGLFLAVHKSAANAIVRLNADGTVDTTFRAPVMTPEDTLFRPTISAVALQTDGKILIGGNFITVGGLSYPGIARLNSDGSLDTTFASGDGYNLDRSTTELRVADIEVGVDNKITFGGHFEYGTFPNKKYNLARVFADGTLDTSLNTDTVLPNPNDDVYEILLLPGDEMMVSIGTTVYRLLSTGTPDMTLPSSGPVRRFARQADGKLLLAGPYSINGFPVSSGIVRLNTNDSIDTTFTPPSLPGGVFDVEILSNGKLLVVGAFVTPATKDLILLNPDGTTDPSFNYTGTVIVAFDAGVQQDGKIVVGGEANNFVGAQNPPLVRLNADGSLDSTQVVVGNGGRANDLFIEPSGNILAGGFFTHADGVFVRYNYARVSADGVFDPSSLAPNLFTTEINGLDVLPSNIILIAANNTIAKITASQTGQNIAGGFSYDFVPLPDGRALASLNNFLRRVNTNNTIDFSFDVPVNALIRRIALQPDGKILICGFFTTVKGTSRARIARLNADGTLDTTFDPPGGANNTVNDMALQPDGKIIIGGSFTGVNFDTNYPFLARLNSNGTLDTSFHPSVQGETTRIKLQPDGKILVGGVALFGNTARNTVKRFNPDGTSDLSFSLGSGTDGPVRSIELQSGNRILIGGEFRTVNGVDRLGMARLLNNVVVRTLFDYDGDSKADISVFRASENRWYVFKSSDSTVTQTVFAIAGDVPVPADYDGDLKTDVAIYRPSNGAWWYLSSINGAQINVNWGGEAGDIPRPSDFDGDGKTDFIIFRPTNNTWYRISPLGGVSNVQFGLSGDKPVIGDFDGDGKSDVAIYRPSTGDWWYQSSINNAQLAVRWGISTDIPAPADFDGDGRTDFAVYRPSTGVWYVINSSNGSFLIGPFGIPEDKPVPADYDGDGKAELAVFRPSSGIWYQLRTNGGFFAMQFGIGTDTPTPNAFVP